MTDKVFTRGIKYADLPAYKYKLLHEVVYKSKEVGNFVLHNNENTTQQKFVSIDIKKQELRILPGFCWDGPSGPVPDLNLFMYPSLVHDALYFLIRAKVLVGTKDSYQENKNYFNNPIKALEKSDKALYQKIKDHHRESVRYLSDAIFADLCKKNGCLKPVADIMGLVLQMFASYAAQNSKQKEYDLLIADNI